MSQGASPRRPRGAAAAGHFPLYSERLLTGMSAALARPLSNEEPKEVNARVESPHQLKLMEIRALGEGLREGLGVTPLLSVTEGVRDNERVIDWVRVREVEGVTEGVLWAVRELMEVGVGAEEGAFIEDAVGVEVEEAVAVLVPGKFVEDHVRVTLDVPVEMRT